MVKINGFILDELENIRDTLFDSLPTGSIQNSFSLIKCIKKHIKDLDRITEHYRTLENDIKRLNKD